MAKTTMGRDPREGIYPELYSWMARHGYTMSEFAELIGVATSTLRRFLDGNNDIQKSTIDKILKLTGLRYGDAFRKEEVEV